MKKEMIYLFMFVLFVSFVNADVVINEIMYNPEDEWEGSEDYYNEWIEIYNNGTEDVNLTGWTLCGKEILSGYLNRADKDIYLSTTMILEPNQYAIISDGGTKDTRGTEVYDNFNVSKYSIALHVNWETLCGGLSNSNNQTIFLNNNNGGLIETMTYNPVWANEGYSIERINTYLDNYEDNWNSSLIEGGTPGRQNSIDEFAPIVNLTFPVNNSYLSYNNVNFSFKVVDNSNILNCSLYLNDVLNQTNETVLNNKLTYFNVFNLDEGFYRWSIICHDGNNNANNSETRLINVDTANPYIFLNINPSILEFGIDNTTVNFTIIDANLDTTIKNLTWPNGTLYITFMDNLTLTNKNLTLLGNYTVYLWANDSLGRESTLEYDIKVQDTITPYFIDNISKVINTNFIIINFTTNENVNVTINYGTDLNLIDNVSESEFSHNHSIEISNLSSGTAYYYNLSVCDESNNCNVYSDNFTTLEIVEDSGGGNNNPGGGSPSSKTYEVEIGEATSLNLNRNDKVEFIFVNEQHSLRIKTLSRDYVIFIIASEPQEVRFESGEIKNIDLNLDSSYDIYVKVNNFDYNSVSIEIGKFSEEVVNEETERNDEIKIEENITENEIISNNQITGAFTFLGEGNPKTGGIIVAVIVVLGLLIYFVLNKKS
jgi:hypothetical protein